MEENIFFDQSGVSVFNARFIVHGQTYAMNGATSVRQTVNHPPRLGPVVLGIVGLIAVINGGTAMVIGAVLPAGAVLWWTKQKPDWIVVLNSSSGEVSQRPLPRGSLTLTFAQP